MNFNSRRRSLPGGIAASLCPSSSSSLGGDSGGEPRYIRGGEEMHAFAGGPFALRAMALMGIAEEVVEVMLS